MSKLPKPSLAGSTGCLIKTTYFSMYKTISYSEIVIGTYGDQNRLGYGNCCLF